MSQNTLLIVCSQLCTLRMSVWMWGEGGTGERRGRRLRGEQKEKKQNKKKEAKLMKRTLLAWSRSEPICVHLHLGWNLQLRASRRCIMTGCHNNTGGGPAGKMTALSLLRKDETLATCNSPRSAASFLPAAWLNGTFEGSKSTKLCLITLPEPECLTGWGVFVGGRRARGSQG